MTIRKMILVPHDPRWADEFARIQEVYLQALGTRILRVEHVGSTAVPDLLAKPILDIDIVMSSYDAFAGIAAGLRELGYTHNGDQGIAGREAFKEQGRQAPYTWPRRTWMAHHLYVCPVDGREFCRHVAFRDALRARADLGHEYEALKAAIAARAGGDRKAYARIKEVDCRAFVERVLQSALTTGADAARP